MQNFDTLLLVGTLAVWTACAAPTAEKPAQAPPLSAASIPELPKRSAEFGDPTEYDRLLDGYDTAKKRLTRNANDQQAWLRMAEVFITDARITGHYQADHDAALTILDGMLQRTKQPDVKQQALTLKAVIRLSQHAFEDALKLGEEAVKLDPHRAFNYGILVDANTELGRYDEAVKACDRMVATRPDLRSYSRVSYQREIHGDIPGAIHAMGMAVQAGYPGAEETSWCLVQLGGLHERQGDLDSARTCYERANTERANYPFALAALGRVNGKEKAYPEAEKQLKKAIALMPEAAFYEELARVYTAQGRTAEYAQAVDSAERVLLGLSKGAEGHSHQVGLEMAKFQYEFRDQLDLALANAEHERTHRPDNIDVNALLADLYYAKGDLEKSRTHLAIAERTGSTDAGMRCLHGLLALGTTDAAKGKAMIAEALRSDPYQRHPLIAEARRSL